MGFLNWKSNPTPAIQRLPSGAFTVDRFGNIISTTVPSDFPQNSLSEIADQTLALFREARAAALPLNEINLHFAEFFVTARDMQGGAIIFLSPKNVFATQSPAI